MAEIKVENRGNRGGPPHRDGGFKLWWLLPLLLLALLAWYLLRDRDHDDDATPVVTDTTTIVPAPAPAPVTADTMPAAPPGTDTTVAGTSGTGTAGMTQDTTVTTDSTAGRP